MIHECVLPKLIFFGANVAGKAVPVGLLLLHLRVKINNRLVFDVRLARVVLLSSNQNVYIIIIKKDDIYEGIEITQQ